MPKTACFDTRHNEAFFQTKRASLTNKPCLVGNLTAPHDFTGNALRPQNVMFFPSAYTRRSLITFIAVR